MVLYARLHIGRIMLWWCPFGFPSVYPSVRQFSPFLVCILLHIKLKFFFSTIWFHKCQIRFECRQFPLFRYLFNFFFVRVVPFLELWNTWNTQVSALFSCMLWYIELKFYIWFFECQIKFECHHFPFILVNVMPLLELTILVFRTLVPAPLTKWTDILQGSGGEGVVKLLVCGGRDPGFELASRKSNFIECISPASDSPYDWKIIEVM